MCIREREHRAFGFHLDYNSAKYYALPLKNVCALGKVLQRMLTCPIHNGTCTFFFFPSEKGAVSSDIGAESKAVRADASCSNGRGGAGEPGL